MGVLTTIQRFSLHDGPGIRSTVFFKGCNMRCKWCHNPETLTMKPEVLYYKIKCVGCGACTAVCEGHSVEGGKMVHDRDKCGEDMKCADVCFSGALEVCGKEYSVDDVLFEVLQDKDYYEQSGGGVTLSGGEVLLQPQFAGEVLKALKEKGVSTAIETNMNVDWSVIEALLPDVDLVMCDLKTWDSDLHKEWTAVGNERIKENIAKLGASGKPVIVRTPIIPGVNDNAQEIGAIAAFVSQLPSLKYYELLNFNPLGHSKYAALDADNVFVEARPLPEDKLNALADAARAVCGKVRVG